MIQTFRNEASVIRMLHPWQPPETSHGDAMDALLLMGSSNYDHPLHET